ncbi:MAG: ergothioneine biosynthesis protein EgtB [Myxococcota bacterium]|nr:ergothioneine biosynthesis protein EgtB [Myxococcota bacterium]
MKSEPKRGAFPAAALQAEKLASDFREVRARTQILAAPLSPEDCSAQSMPDASPTKWHMAHTTWFFETFVLEASTSGFMAFDESFKTLFNSYYNSVGDQYPRPRRGLLTRPSLARVREYREQVDEKIIRGLEADAFRPETLSIIELGLHHEEQHQELILSDILHLLSINPQFPAYRQDLPEPAPQELAPLTWHAGLEGIQGLGHPGVGFSFDNEGPRHEVLVAPHALASRLVSNLEFRAFMEDDGYSRPELWLSEGWTLCQDESWQAPLYWQKADADWNCFGLGGLGPMVPSEPVSHISLFEADAYARWADARLPLEIEWELSAKEPGPEDNLAESGRLRPNGLSSRGELGPHQLFGDVWEWTQSAYQAYPGYRPGPGALGEYNGKFMSNQNVLRGGSCVTPRRHIRSTYRNFFPAHARWQWSGLRLAKDA